MTEPDRPLKPANENPLYVLMTLYGEVGDEGYDAEANRKAWNIWACQNLDEESKKKSYLLKQDDPDLDWVGPDILNFEAEAIRIDEIKERHKEVMDERNMDSSGYVYPGFPEPNCRVDLRGYRFAKTFNIRRFIFPSFFGFTDSMFERDVYVVSAIFLREFGGVGTVFSRDLHLTGAVFFGNTSLNQVICKKNVQSTDCVHFRDMSFQDAEIESNAYFNYSIYKGRVSFRGTNFQGHTSFDSAKFRGAQHGGKTTQADADFSKVAFSKFADFRGSVFANKFPILDGVRFQKGVSFSARDQNWPNDKRLSDVEDRRYVENAKDTCALIRHELSMQGLPEDAHFFFRREMGFAEKMTTGLAVFPYRIYRFCSDYGASLKRPTCGLIIIGSIGFAAISGFYCQANAPRPFLTGIGLSFSNIFPVFGFGRIYFEDLIREMPAALKFVSALQTISSLPFLFFLGLGLRHRFRLR